MRKTTERDETGLMIPTVKSFPAKGTNLYKLMTDDHHRVAFYALLKRYNPLIVALYKIGLLPLFGVSRTVMLLTTRGNKSGKLRRTPIGYFRIGGDIYVFSGWGKSSTWYKNMQAWPDDIRIHIGLRSWPVCAQVLSDPGEINALLARFVVETPVQAKTLLGWEPGHDCVAYADFTPMIERVLIVRFRNK